MDNLELQEYINWTLNLEVERIRNAKHAPRPGMRATDSGSEAEELPQA